MARQMIAFDKRTTTSLVRAYEKGASSTALAEEQGCSTATILRILREQGVEIRPRGKRTTAAA